MTTTTAPQNPAQVICSLIHRISKEITYHHEQLKMTGIPMGRSYTIQLRAGRADTPRLVGERGAHVRAFQTLVRVFGARYKAQMDYQLLEPNEGVQEPMKRFQPRETWDKKPTEQLAADLASALTGYPVTVDIVDQPNHISALTVMMDDKEDRALVEALNEPFRVIFNAIGKSKGRILHAEVTTKGERNGTVQLAPVNIG